MLETTVLMILLSIDTQKELNTYKEKSSIITEEGKQKLTRSEISTLPTISRKTSGTNVSYHDV